MDSPSIDAAVAILERHLERYKPLDYVRRRIQSVRDIYEYRSTLKELSGDDDIIRHVAGVIVEAIESGQRMRTLECAKVLRALVRSVGDEPLSNQTMNKLFTVYKNFIFSGNEDAQWCISSVIKGRPLPDDAITWLVDNANKSEHLVNRLLLYPEPNDNVVSWVKKIYERDQLQHRRAEVVAILLTPDNAPQFANDVDQNTLAWAIFKSRLPRERKIELLVQHSCLESFWSVVDIADRLRTQELLEAFLHKLRAE